MEEEFRAILLEASGVTALCGDRINWGGHPQGQPGPYIVLWVVSDFEGHTLEGPDGMSAGRVQVDVYAGTYGQAKQLARAVRGVLDGYSDGGFQGVFLAGNRDTREGGTNDVERPFRVSLDFITIYNPT